MTASPHGPAADRREAMRQSIRALLGPGGAAAALFPGYEARPGQLAMADRIADAIDGDERVLVEAGTGTGKTLAYLVPALLSGRKVVVSTGTKTLQDQIAGVDLPRLRTMFDRAGLLPAPLEWAVPAAPAGARPPALAAARARAGPHPGFRRVVADGRSRRPARPR
jgi:Rad3-related DNA helicase